MHSFLVLQYKKYKAIFILLAVYFFMRLLFQQFPLLKSAFIYPCGYIISFFTNLGEYQHPEWIYHFNNIEYILGASCSGTTFFSLLIAFVSYQMIKNKTPWYFLLLAYPVALLANSIRVLSAIYTHNILYNLDLQNMQETSHVIIGTLTFICVFLAYNFFLEKKGYL